MTAGEGKGDDKLFNCAARRPSGMRVLIPFSSSNAFVGAGYVSAPNAVTVLFVLEEK
jgi:hypothetical protein